MLHTHHILYYRYISAWMKLCLLHEIEKRDFVFSTVTCLFVRLPVTLLCPLCITWPPRGSWNQLAWRFSMSRCAVRIFSPRSVQGQEHSSRSNKFKVRFLFSLYLLNGCWDLNNCTDVKHDEPMYRKHVSSGSDQGHNSRLKLDI